MNLHFFIPGDLNTLTGGYIYDKRMVDGLRLNGHNVKVYSLSDDFPFPFEENKRKCQNSIYGIPKGEIIIFDSLIFGSIPDLLNEVKQDHIIVALIHLPLSINKGFSDNERKKLSILEKEAFIYANLIVVTSNYIKNVLIDNGINPKLITAIIPGVEALVHKKDYNQVPFKLLTISNYTRNKGHLLLISALIQLKKQDWRLDCYGNKNFDPDYVQELSDLIVDNHLTERIFLHSSISGYKLSEIYVNADLLIHPSEFESYGMVLTEALAHGIPVIASTGGATTQTVPASMGIFFDVNDSNSLRDCIEQLMIDEDMYKDKCTNAAKYINQAQSWEKSVREFENALQNLER